MKIVSILGVVVLAGAVLYFFMSDPLTFTIFGLLVAILVYVLVKFGFVSAKVGATDTDITYRPDPSESESSAHGKPPPSRTILEEVFYVANNIFTYETAPTVCKAYGGALATYDQVEEAYSKGAEWCGYGWTAGGMALFPTQEATWTKLQQEIDPKKRIACGRPGINGGYFEPSQKFGVNCYGIRPTAKIGEATGDRETAAAVARMKAMLSKLGVDPFNSKEWSEYTGASNTIHSAETGIQEIGSDIEKEVKTVGLFGSGAFKTLGDTARVLLADIQSLL